MIMENLFLVEISYYAYGHTDEVSIVRIVIAKDESEAREKVGKWFNTKYNSQNQVTNRDHLTLTGIDISETIR